MITREPKDLAVWLQATARQSWLKYFRKYLFTAQHPILAGRSGRKLLFFNLLLIFLFLASLVGCHVQSRQSLNLSHLLVSSLETSPLLSSTPSIQNFNLICIWRVLTRSWLHLNSSCSHQDTGSLKGARPYLTYLWQYKILYPTQWHHELTKLWV